MNLKKKISFLEKKLKNLSKDNVVVFTGYDELEFEEKIKDHKKNHPEAGIYVFVKKFTKSIFSDLKGIDRK